LRRVRDVSLNAYQHQDIPFEKLVEELRPNRDLGRSPFFQVMLTLEKPEEELRLPGLQSSDFAVDSGIAKFDLLFALRDEAGRITGEISYDRELYEPETVERIGEHLEILLESAAGHEEQRISELDWFSETERRRVLLEWNETQEEYPQTSVQRLLEDQVSKAGDAVAVVDSQRQLSYAELNRRSNQLAHYLRRLGIGNEAHVAVCMERSAEMIVAVLGIIKAGAAYVGVDPAYPDARKAFILKDAQVAAVIAGNEERRLWETENSVPVLRLDQDWNVLAKESGANPEGEVSPDQLCYISFTSGSTGKPKGVAVPHRGVVRLVFRSSYVRLDANDVFLQFAPLAFDASTLEIWGCLLNGGKLVIGPQGDGGLKLLGDTVLRQQITVLWLTAGLFHSMVEEEPEALCQLKKLLAGGDVVSARQASRFLSTAAPETRLINGYGPTENTTFTCCQGMNKESRIESTVPIGRPIGNTQVYVLDEEMRPVAVGAAGELWAGGAGLARGYINAPEITAEKFMPHPFSLSGGERLYRTGDQVRYRCDGSLEFLGRRDEQVKLRGYRVELGEIEATLRRQQEVEQAIVLIRGEEDKKRLVAFVVPRHENLSSEDLRSYLQQRLPGYMLPTRWVFLNELPLTRNGKVDRNALIGREDTSPEAAKFGFKTPTEEIVAGIWCEVLGVEFVGREDNFFELGGH